MGIIMQIDESVFNHGKIEFQHIDYGYVFLFDNELYMKIELNPIILSFVFKCSSKGVHEITNGCAINLISGQGEVFADNCMVEPVKAVIKRK